jgi:hypothetical protein
VLRSVPRAHYGKHEVGSVAAGRPSAWEAGPSTLPYAAKSCLFLALCEVELNYDESFALVAATSCFSHALGPVARDVFEQPLGKPS